MSAQPIAKQIQVELGQVTHDRANAIIKRKGYTSYGVATVVAQLVDAIGWDEKRIFTVRQRCRRVSLRRRLRTRRVSTRADPAYDVGNEVVLGLPCIIGKYGIESRLVLPIQSVEQNLLQASATKLNDTYQATFGRYKPCFPTVA
ncbi:hypothetical protein H6G17_24855 [Chroococcidiopsis sp. FACHB-1243]|nr:hypothetical protein [Chroococcidiopsis sp. [FACHB-1243]]